MTWFNYTIIFSDVDECEESKHNNCSSNANCQNTDGSFMCECLGGFTGDGVNCTPGKEMFLDYLPFKRERQYFCASSPWILFTYFHPVANNCAELHKSDNKNKTSGVFTISPGDEQAFDVLCDQTTVGGGWTVFQKRLDGSVDFFRNWADYKQGFGNLSGEFWLGLDKIHRLTSQTNNKLRVELEDFQGNMVYAEYDTFAVGDEADNYRLSVAGYKGNHEVRTSLVNSVVLLTDQLRSVFRPTAISNSCMQHSRREGGIEWVANGRLLTPPSPIFFWNRIREIIRTADKVNAHNYLIQYALVQWENIHDFLLDIMYRSINSKLASTCATSRRNAPSKHEIEAPNKIPTPLVLWSNPPPQGRCVLWNSRPTPLRVRVSNWSVHK